MPLTATGVERSVVVPLPSSDKALTPQHSTVPPERRAQVSKTPALTAVAFVMPLTETGVGLPISVPLPSSPPLFQPQHLTVPPERTAQVCVSPAPMGMAVFEVVVDEGPEPQPHAEMMRAQARTDSWRSRLGWSVRGRLIVPKIRARLNKNPLKQPAAALTADAGAHDSTAQRVRRLESHPAGSDNRLCLDRPRSSNSAAPGSVRFPTGTRSAEAPAVSSSSRGRWFEFGFIPRSCASQDWKLVPFAPRPFSSLCSRIER